MNDPDSAKPRHTTQIDRLGNKVKIPQGYTFKQGSNGKGIAVPPSARTEKDRFGQIYSVPLGHRTVRRSDGTLDVLKHGESSIKSADENEEVVKPPKFKRKAFLSAKEAIRLSEQMARKYGKGK